MRPLFILIWALPVFFSECKFKGKQDRPAAFDSLTKLYSSWPKNRSGLLENSINSFVFKSVKVRIIYSDIADSGNYLIVFSDDHHTQFLPADPADYYWPSADSLKKLHKDTTLCFEYGLNKAMAVFNINNPNQAYKLADSLFKHLLHATPFSYADVKRTVGKYQDKLNKTSGKSNNCDNEANDNWRMILNDYKLRDMKTVYFIGQLLRIIQITQIEQKSDGHIYIHLKSYRIPCVMLA